MHMPDNDSIMELVRRTRVSGPAVVVNQCDRDSREQIGDVLILNTTERGLSRSRNMAIANATGDILLICDDDEILDEDYQEKICKAYTDHPDCSVAVFKYRPDNGYKRPWDEREVPLGTRTCFTVSSILITFKRRDILEHGIRFDTRLGSGASHAGGEENKFCLDCLRAGLRGICLPVFITYLIPDSGSQWWKGNTDEYLADHAKFARIILGSPKCHFYNLFHALRHRKEIQKDNRFWHALRVMYRAASQPPAPQD